MRIESIDPEVWRVQDEEWMQERRKSWRKVQQRLPGLKDEIHRNYWKHIKEYYFFGNPFPLVHKPFVSSAHRKFLELWLYPIDLVPGETIYEDEFDKYPSMRRVFSESYSGIRSAIADQGDAEYGAMNGREQLIMLDLNRGIDPENRIDFGSGKLHRSCSDPSIIISHCEVGTMDETRSFDIQPFKSEPGWDSRYVAFSTGIVLWDKVSEILDNNPYAIHPDGSPGNCGDTFNLAINAILTFYDRDPDDESHSRLTTIEFVDRMLNQYKDRKFSENLLAYWDAASERIR